MNRLRRMFVVLTISLLALPAFADGGMWTLDMIQTQIGKMQEEGLSLDALDIYNPSGKPSLMDGVVFFDGGCSGVLVSNQSLLLTNHHCGYDKIQALSSVGANYLRDGFISHSLQEELPCPGLVVEQVESIKEVTLEVKKLLELKKSEFTTGMEYLSPKFLSSLAPQIVGRAAVKDPRYRYEIKAFFGGNKYYLFKNKVFTDVRLVAAPPSSIGKYGADTDNWIWPRHTGDFSIFRLYADKSGNPAPYSKDNVPYTPKKWIPINGKGVQEDDFVMIMGFPGTTYHYFTAEEVKEWGEIDNNIRIEMRGIRQEIMLRAMHNDEKINIMYAAKYASSQNGYKRAQGANWAIEKRHLEATKRAQQEALLERAKKAGNLKATNAVFTIEQNVKARRDLRYRERYLMEGLLLGIEFTRAPLPDENLVSKNPVEQKQAVGKLKKRFDLFFDKDYSPALDKEIAKAILSRYCDRVKEGARPKVIDEGLKAYGSVEAYIEHVFNTSIFASRERFEEFMKAPDYQKVLSDPMSLFAQGVVDEYNSLKRALLPFDAPIKSAQRDYISVNMAFPGNEILWPDANLTLRFTYGKVKGYVPRDVVSYGAITSLTGVMEKEDPNNPEYVLPKRMKEIYANKDYGRYAMKNGSMPVNFCATTHTTGGNSGSPVFDRKGQLVGLNFDRNWEGVGGDIEYLGDYQRSIILDARYLLLVVDKYLGGERLIKEMNPQF